MSEIFNHTLEFRDLDSIRILLNTPIPDRNNDIEMHMIAEERSHPFNGFMKDAMSNLRNGLSSVGQWILDRVTAQPAQDRLEAKSYAHR